MSAVLVMPTRRAEPALPPTVARKIAAFLAAGTTGQIVLDIKHGQVHAFKLTEAGRVPAAELDGGAGVPHDTGN